MNVKLRRIEKQITQAELCKIVKTSPKKMVRIEKGDFSNVTYDLMIRIAKALDTTVQELFFSEEE